MMWSLLLGGALAVPQLNQEKSSVKYSLATIKHVWTDASGGVQTATERWNMLILTLDFSEDLYVDYKGVLTRIDELPIAPKIKGWDHFTHIPGFSVPLNRILGGVFEVQASDPEKCGGISPNSRANQWKMFQTGGAFSHPVLTGMPPFEAIGGNPVRTNCGTKEWSPNGCTGKPAPPLPTNEYGADGGCAGRDDFDICPAFATLPYEGETGRGTLMEGLSYVCLAGQCVAGVTPRGSPAFMAGVLPSRADAVFEHMVARQGSYIVNSTARPNQLKLALWLPGDDPDNPDDDFWWYNELKPCGFKVAINSLAKADSPFGMMAPGKYPVTPAVLKGADGSAAIGTADFTPAIFASPTFLSQAQADCTEEEFQGAASSMLGLADAFKRVKSTDDLRGLRMTIRAFTEHPAMRVCRQLFDSMVTKKQGELTVGETSQCMLPEYDDFSQGIRNLEWGGDCKCNRTLRATSCCAPSASTMKVSLLDGIKQDVVAQKCSNPAVILQLLNDAVLAGEATVTARDEDARRFEEEVWTTESAFLEECQRAAHEVVCNSPSQCKYGSFCANHGKCSINNLAHRGEYYLQCYAHKMGLEKRKLFQKHLGYEHCNFMADDGTADTSLACYPAALAEFISRYSTKECEGQTGQQYRSTHNRTTNEYGHDEWVRVPANEAGCLSDGYCLGDNSWPRTTYKMNSGHVCPDTGVGMCFECTWGNDCHPAGTQYELCEVVAFERNQTLCLAAGYTWTRRDSHQYTCADTTKTTQDACVVPNDWYNHHFPGGPKSTLRVTGEGVWGGDWVHCAKKSVTRKKDLTSKQWEVTNGGRISGVDKTWNELTTACPNGFLSHLGHCASTNGIVNNVPISADPCDTSNGFSLVPGWRWRFGKYDNATMCSLGCSDENQFWRGADQATCEAQSSCSEKCSYCGSHWRRQQPPDLSRSVMCLDTSSYNGYSFEGMDGTQNFASPAGTAPANNDPMTQCQSDGNEFFSRNEYVPASNAHMRRHYGCVQKGILTKAECDAKSTADSPPSPYEFWDCEMFGDPNLPRDAANNARCKTDNWDPITQTSTQVFPPEAPIGSKTRYILEHLSCTFQRHQPCRTDDRLCELGSAMGNYEALCDTSKATGTPGGPIDCSQASAVLEKKSTECVSSGAGRCSDDEYHFFDWDHALQRPKPGCLLPYEMNEHGDVHCPHDKCRSWSKKGCLNKCIPDYTSCVAQGGQWVQKAQTAAECAAAGKECSKWADQLRTPALNAATGAYECGGCIPNMDTYAANDVYTFTPATWKPNRYDRRLHWKVKQLTPINAVIFDVDRSKFEVFVRELVALELGRRQASDFMREWIPKNALLATIACACTQAKNASLPTDCFVSPDAAAAKVAAIRAKALSSYASSYDFASGALDGLSATDTATPAAAASRRALVQARALAAAVGPTGVPLNPFFEEEALELAELTERSEPHHARRFRRRLAVAAGVSQVTAAAPQETAVGVALAGQELTLAVPGRGSATLSATAVDSSNDNAEVELKALPAAVMNSDARARLYGSCDGQPQNLAEKEKFDVVTDLCGQLIGQVVGDGLAVRAAAALREQVRLCITPRADIAQNSAAYPTIDIVVDEGSGQLTAPLQISPTLTSGDYCFYGTTGVAYVPIRRTDTIATAADSCPSMPPSFPPCPPAPPRDTEAALADLYGPFGCFKWDTGCINIWFIVLGFGVGSVVCCLLCCWYQRRRQHRRDDGAVMRDTKKSVNV